MSPKKKDDKRNGSGDDTSGGGAGGKVEFHDFITSTKQTRDDMLPPDEIRRLRDFVHKDRNANSVKKQKESKENLKAVKEGKKTVQEYRQGLGGTGMSSQFKSHPVLSVAAQFSGIDRTVTPLPTENNENTNDELKDKLENEYRLTHQLQNVPRPLPKPTPP